MGLSFTYYIIAAPGSEHNWLRKVSSASAVSRHLSFVAGLFAGSVHEGLQRLSAVGEVPTRASCSFGASRKDLISQSAVSGNGRTDGLWHQRDAVLAG